MQDVHEPWLALISSLRVVIILTSKGEVNQIITSFLNCGVLYSLQEYHSSLENAERRTDFIKFVISFPFLQAYIVLCVHWCIRYQIAKSRRLNVRNS